MPPKTKKDEQDRGEAANVTAFTAVLTAKLAESKSELLAEIKDTYARYEAKLTGLQNSVEDHDQRITSLEQFANSTSDELTDVPTELAAVASENAKLKARLIDLSGRTRRNNIRIVGLPEQIENQTRPTEFFSQLLCDVLGADILSSPPRLDRAHRAQPARLASTGRPRHVVICFHHFQTRELVVRAARQLRGGLKYKDTPIHIFEDYVPEVLEQRAQYRDVMERLFELGYKPALRYPAKLSVVLHDGSRKLLPTVKEAADFASRHRRRDDPEVPATPRLVPLGTGWKPV
uniref:L1 transposable element RRM domain-containing protein n=1 Tax=Knipowitschia caucasica TaxID=637954 RepID=A0AAV2KCT3_KNICA